MDTGAYLDRIGYAGPTAPTVETLAALQRAHLLAVPFENLDIHLGRPISQDEGALFAKIVGERRGGFCYELNGLFAALLRALGFGVTQVSARFPNPDATDGYGPEFDHQILLATVPGESDRWLADAAGGRTGSTRPLRLVPGEEQPDPHDGTPFRLAEDGSGGSWTLWRMTDGTWGELYRFSTIPRRSADFAAMCRHHQTSPDSPFPNGLVCSRLNPDGRVTLGQDRLIVTHRGVRTETPLADPGAVRAALQDHFGIALPADRPLRSPLAGPIAVSGSP
ncbi:MAG: hypothetical protein AVDCRST_MAG73-1839 [uncultured Thermomicrobiales bacterium]|uniref:Arylamine N-acetyltransferase n=1 Tax=uncultured Thermomicrobiales bacterium TaxID=1645740 RepID=A0A6J4U4S4_9BACT|nr:MAG: hypothetical protein AVDCRST_MAG73-1839 [uncultured Thermomicrobiales bacterium]